MTFDELVPAIDANLAAEKQRCIDQERTFEAERAFHALTSRTYEVGDGWALTVDLTWVRRHMTYEVPCSIATALARSLHLSPRQHTGQLSPRTLRNAADAAEHVNDWLHGSVDELLPSGLWVQD